MAEDRRAAASTRTVELVVACLILALGVVVAADSWRLGARWAEDGPQGGYFPFYIGLLLVISSAVVIVRALRAGPGKAFVERGQFKLILTLLVPSIVYVALIGLVGIYIASILFIGFFMLYLGRYGIGRTAAVAFGVAIVFFLVFEVWFKVPLPKGPVEAWLGLA